MPTYEFRCPDGHEFEKFYRTISGAESESVCPVCGKLAERFMSAAGFAFKGSGFYLTDYGKNAHRGEAPPKAGASSGEGSSGDSAKSDNGSSGGDSASTSSSSDSAKSSESSSPAKPEKKPEAKPAEAKPAKAPPKPSSSE